MKKHIVEKIGREFPCFGGGSGSAWGNPIAEALKDKPLVFAAGVDVENVVLLVATMVLSGIVAKMKRGQDPLDALEETINELV